MKRACVCLIGLMMASALWAAPKVAIPLAEKGTMFPPQWKPHADTTAWQRVSIEVPREWKGRRVAFDVPYSLNKCDLVLEVNGKKAGEILRPAGFIDVSDKVRYGETNEFAWALTSSGKLTSRGEAPTVDFIKYAGHGLTRAPDLVMTPKTWIEDVFANTSWREKKLKCEVEIGSTEKVKVGGEGEQWTISVSVKDQEGRAVKTGERKVVVKPGENHFVVDIPWSDPICWELGRPYLYTAEVSLVGSTSTPQTYAYEPFTFGFREVWREGKEIMMNGHKAHWRLCYPYGVHNTAGGEFLMDIGYNVIGLMNHDATCIGKGAIKKLEDFDRLGLGILQGLANGPNVVCNRTVDDPETARLFRTFMKMNHRFTRNHPSILASSVAVMIICDIGAHNPLYLGANESTTARSRLINLFRDINREYNPNILYYSHADGNNGDIASGNLYLNWTPLQEREEWLSKWTTNGVMPWMSVEFGEPYMGNWHKGQVMLPTEYFAETFGDRAYAEEPFEVQQKMLTLGATCGFHGAPVQMETITTHPLFWEHRRLWTWRTNSRWRAFGLNGGNSYFNLSEAYGYPDDSREAHGYGRYSLIKESLNHRKPAWANPAYDIHQLGNKDFCGFLGGAPEFTDHTHAYYAGEKIAKQAVFIWDGLGARQSSAEVKVEKVGGGEVWKTRLSAAVKQGEVAKVPFDFAAPQVSSKTAYTISVTFDDGFVDAMSIEVYPRVEKPLAGMHEKVALFDPECLSAPILDTLGIGYVKVQALDDLKDATRLVVGRNALSKAALGDRSAALRAGLKVLVLAQQPMTWQSLGFKVQDPMLRQVFVRDPALKAELSDDMLAYWRGAPKYGEKPYGNVMSHAAQRGPRWTRTHTVAGLMLQNPARVGFLPLVDGLFDMDYSALLEYRDGKGSVTFCTLDFEDRVPSDPAATVAAKSVFARFLAPTGVDQSREKTSAPKFLATRENAEGVYSMKPADAALAAAIGPSLLRWTVPVKVEKAADGTFVIPPDYFTDAEKSAKKEPKNDERETYRFNQMKLTKLLARAATLCGERPDPMQTRRLFYQAGVAAYEPLPALQVCGPFASKKDDSRHMLDTIWNKTAEEMMVAGDYNPNITFKLPQGGETDWRPTVTGDAKGRFDFGALHPDIPCQVNYAIATIRRKADGEALLKLGADWRMRVWVNGEEVFRRERGCHYPGFDVRVKLKKGDNVITFKHGGGRAGASLWALLEAESSGAFASKSDPELDAVTLYDELIPGLDPYTFYYW